MRPSALLFCKVALWGSDVCRRGSRSYAEQLRLARGPGPVGHVDVARVVTLQWTRWSSASGFRIFGLEPQMGSDPTVRRKASLTPIQRSEAEQMHRVAVGSGHGRYFSEQTYTNQI